MARADRAFAVLIGLAFASSAILIALLLTLAPRVEQLADPRRLRLLHALAVGEETAQRAAVWAGLEQGYAERELAALALLGIVERRDGPHGPVYVPHDGHLVVQVHVALAHGRESRADQHPRLMRRRAPVTVRGRRAG